MSKRTLVVLCLLLFTGLNAAIAFGFYQAEAHIYEKVVTLSQSHQLPDNWQTWLTLRWRTFLLPLLFTALAGLSLLLVFADNIDMSDVLQLVFGPTVGAFVFCGAIWVIFEWLPYLRLLENLK